MRIVALDLGKHNTVACLYESSAGEHRFETIKTRPQVMHDLLIEHTPERLVLETDGRWGID